MSVDAQKVTVYKKINNQTIPLYLKTSADMVVTDSGNTIADVLSDGTIIKYCSNATYASDTKTIRCTVDGITLRTGATFLLKLPVDLSEDNLKLNVNNLGAKDIHIGGSRTSNPYVYTDTNVNGVYGAKQNGVCMFMYDTTLESNAGAWVLISGYAVDSQTKYGVGLEYSEVAEGLTVGSKKSRTISDEYFKILELQQIGGLQPFQQCLSGILNISCTRYYDGSGNDVLTTYQATIVFNIEQKFDKENGYNNTGANFGINVLYSSFPYTDPEVDIHGNEVRNDNFIIELGSNGGAIFSINGKYPPNADYICAWSIVYVPLTDTTRELLYGGVLPEQIYAKQPKLHKDFIVVAPEKPVATAESAGLMSAADKAKLDTIDEYADHTIVMTTLGEYTQPCSTWTVYRAFQDKVDNKLGAANGIATLDSNSKLTSSQLPSTAVTTSSLGSASGIATLDSNSKLTASQLPSTVVTTANCGVASGVATLDSNGKIPTSQLPNSISGASIEWHTFSEI